MRPTHGYKRMKKHDLLNRILNYTENQINHARGQLFTNAHGWLALDLLTNYCPALFSPAFSLHFTWKWHQKLTEKSTPTPRCKTLESNHNLSTLSACFLLTNRLFEFYNVRCLRGSHRKWQSSRLSKLWCSVEALFPGATFILLCQFIEYQIKTIFGRNPYYRIWRRSRGIGFAGWEGWWGVA